MTTLQAATYGRSATLTVAAAGAGLAMVAYTTPLATLAGTAAALDAGPDGQAWILSSMSAGPGGRRCCPAARSATTAAAGGCSWPAPAGSAAASVLGALAPDTAALVAARIGQGLGAAAVLACSLGLIGHAFPAGPQRARATGVWGAGIGAGIAVGPLLAGRAGRLGGLARPVLAGRGPGRGAGRGGAPGYRSRAARSAARVDLPGMLLLGAALTALLAGLVEVGPGGAAALVVALLAAGAGLAVRRSCVVELRRRPRCSTRGCFAARTSPARPSARWSPGPGSSP